MATADGLLQLRATLEPRGPAGAIVLTDEQVAKLGGGKAPPVRVTVNGVTVAARIARMGGENLLGLSRKLRADLAVDIGQTIDAVIELDEAQRDTAVPSRADVADAARGPDASLTSRDDRQARTRRVSTTPRGLARWSPGAVRDPLAAPRPSPPVAPHDRRAQHGWQCVLERAQEGGERGVSLAVAVQCGHVVDVHRVKAGTA